MSPPHLKLGSFAFKVNVLITTTVPLCILLSYDLIVVLIALFVESRVCALLGGE